MSGRKASRRERGGVITESALVLPVFVLLVFGMLQYGTVFSAWITVRNASAVGARYWVTSWPCDTSAPGFSASSVASVVRTAASPSLVAANVAVNVSSSGGTNCVVTVSYPVSLAVSRFIPGLSGSSYTVSATTTMR